MTAFRIGPLRRGTLLSFARVCTRYGAPTMLVCLVMVIAVIGPAFAPVSTSAVIGAPWSPAPGTLVGTDALGRDVFSRTIAGGRQLVLGSIPIGITASACGVVLGLLAFRVRWIDRALGTVTATAMALPGTVVVLCAATFLPSIAAVAVGMLVLGAPLSARIVRASAGRLHDAEFIRLAQRRGDSAARIGIVELIPALSSTVLADMAVRVLASLQLLAGLHVLGFGPPPPTPDWAVMVRENLPGILLAPQSVALPAAALALVSASLLMGFDTYARALAPSAGARGGHSHLRVDGHTGEAEHGNGYEPVLDVEELVIGAASEPFLRVDRLRLNPGEIIGIHGPSGAGKTTLIETLALAPPLGTPVSARTFRFLGADPPATEGGRARARRKSIGWSEQDPKRTIDARLSVSRVIADGRRDIDSIALLSRLGLSPHLAGRQAGQISGGQAARVSLARALAGQPRLLVLDEPTAGLDPTTAAVVTDELARFTAGGGAAIIVSHQRSWLDTIATAVAEVSDGVVTFAHPLQNSGQPVRTLPPPGGSAARRQDRDAGSLLGQWTSVTVAVAEPERDDRSGAIAGPRATSTTLGPLDLVVREREVVALLAASGTGKSSLLRRLAAEAPPAEVEVSGNGLPSTGGVTPRGTSLMIQDSATAFNPGRRLLSQIIDHVRLSEGIDGAQARERAAHMLARLEIGPSVAARRPGQCSGGERQRAGLARALLTSAPLVLLDEPTSALDPRMRRAVAALLREEARKGKGILVATHDEELAASADTVIAWADSTSPHSK
ncbi:ATP-binding cassette domain-containing protein [Brevibacterium linens]|uniref:Binding-protein-dependent transport system inner membrane component n=1 Tax=Brevibacterium linens ATCC 9172 TaxID=1255617 RepID=A0A2H1JEL2_BRELN|nr:ATP-binding cassette domain-containing protein [Brevibacterium linens]KAB1947907.1 ATP-binding cassette domain-containing protein [Brevibacterium linens ATCC 9172]MDN5587176.1 ATP-binding cassette domain-containing protein [Brevibacterium sp.]SMX85811.1 Binding-protein-dependent transport system inner membrane component [Brevibacterium linens ATCC 9172]